MLIYNRSFQVIYNQPKGKLVKVTEITPYRAIERFPEYKEAIKQLFRNDHNFKVLCSDYRRCSKAFEFWSKSDLCEAPQRRKEYESLLAELEMEISANLHKRQR